MATRASPQTVKGGCFLCLPTLFGLPFCCDDDCSVEDSTSSLSGHNSASAECGGTHDRFCMMWFNDDFVKSSIIYQKEDFLMAFIDAGAKITRVHLLMDSVRHKKEILQICEVQCKQICWRCWLFLTSCTFHLFQTDCTSCLSPKVFLFFLPWWTSVGIPTDIFLNIFFVL